MVRWQDGRVKCSLIKLFFFFFFNVGIKLREANQQQQFNRNVEDIELWLYEVEGHLASDDYGKDLTNVQNLQKKHALLEADVAAHQVPDTTYCIHTFYVSLDFKSNAWPHFIRTL